MKKRINDLFGDGLEIDLYENVDLYENGRLGITAYRAEECVLGMLFSPEQVTELRDALNQFLEKPKPEVLRPISFGAGGNTVIVINDTAAQFTGEEAKALKTLVSGLVATVKK